MAKRGYRKCVSCKTYFDAENGWGTYAERAPYEGKPLCEACASEDTAEPMATVVSVAEGERITYRVGSYLIEDEYGEGLYGRTGPVADYINSIAWHRTDPWRGYYEGAAPEGWVKVLDDWYGIDGYNVDGDLAAFQRSWQREGETPDFPMIVAFPRGSNVCTGLIEVLVPKEEVEAFKAFIGVEELEVAV